MFGERAIQSSEASQQPCRSEGLTPSQDEIGRVPHLDPITPAAANLAVGERISQTEDAYRQSPGREGLTPGHEVTRPGLGLPLSPPVGNVTGGPSASSRVPSEDQVPIGCSFLSMEPLRERFCKGADMTSPAEFEAALCQLENDPPEIRHFNDNIKEERSEVPHSHRRCCQKGRGFRHL